MWKLSKYNAGIENTNKKIQATNGQYERQLKRDLRGEEDEEQQHVLEAELELLVEELSQLILEDKKSKGDIRKRGECLNRKLQNHIFQKWRDRQ